MRAPYPLLVLGLAMIASAGAASGETHVERWQTFGRAQGLPSDKIQAVWAGPEEVWAGTTEGVARYRAGRWQAWGTAEGLSHRVVLALARSPVTGDVWIGTMGGLCRFSAGRIDCFTQLDSGLANDVVYGVATEGDRVWAATAAGLSRLDTRTGAWAIFTEKNTPMHERWVYNVSAAPDRTYVAVWGGGVLEWDEAGRTWRDYRDPDKEMELDLYRDDGLVHDVTSAVSYRHGVLWVGTYFGMSRYDGRRWRGWQAKDSGLPSNFVNFVRGVGPEAVWVATDRGLAHLAGDTWTIYRRTPEGGGEIRTVKDAQAASRRTTPTGIAHNYVLAVDVQGSIVWAATAKGLSRGVLIDGGGTP